MYSTKLETPISNFEVAMDDTYEDVNDPAITVMLELTSPLSTQHSQEDNITQLGFSSSREIDENRLFPFALYSENEMCGGLIFKKEGIPINCLNKEQEKQILNSDSTCHLKRLLFGTPRIFILEYIRINFFLCINCLRETIPNGIVVWFEVDSEKEAYRIKNAYPNVHNAAYNKLLLYAVVHTIDSVNFIKAFK